MSPHDVYDDITNRIIEQLDAGTVPWHQPWRTPGGPVQINHGRPYRGVNVFLLEMEGRSDPRWGTYRAMRDAAIMHARSQGRKIVVEQKMSRGRMRDVAYEMVDGEKRYFEGGVRKGEHGTHIILWKPVHKKGDGDEDESYLLLRTYVVFNAQQADGMPPLAEPEGEFNPVERAEQVMAGYAFPRGPVVEHGHPAAFYNPAKDKVALPDPESFEDADSYYSTAFHELTHSTGHESRLNRIEPALFGTDPYAKEELVAEMGAAMLAGVSGLPHAGGDNSAAYIASWLRRFHDDRKLVVHAAAQAQKAADLVLGTTFDADEEPSNGNGEEES